MPIILNIETATDVCSVCISKGEEILILKNADQGYAHSSMLSVLIEQCCAETEISLNQLDVVSLSKGPGSYTSLRVGASTAKGVCYALDKPLIAIDTLKSIALSSIENNPQGAFYVPMIDARRMEVYTSVFDEDLNTIQDVHAKIIDKNSFAGLIEKGGKVIFSGNGAPKCQSVIKSAKAIFSDEICDATNLVPLALEAFRQNDFCDVAYFSPSYFKAPNITIPRKTL